MARIVELIYTTDKRGRGTDENPVRSVEQWFEKDGTLVFEKDPCGVTVDAALEVANMLAADWATVVEEQGGDASVGPGIEALRQLNGEIRRFGKGGAQ